MSEPGIEIILNGYKDLLKRHNELVEAVKVLYPYVDLPHSDYCSIEMFEAWDLFKEVIDEGAK